MVATQSTAPAKFHLAIKPEPYIEEYARAYADFMGAFSAIPSVATIEGYQQFQTRSQQDIANDFTQNHLLRGDTSLRYSQAMHSYQEPVVMDAGAGTAAAAGAAGGIWRKTADTLKKLTADIQHASPDQQMAMLADFQLDPNKPFDREKYEETLKKYGIPVPKEGEYPPKDRAKTAVSILVVNPKAVQPVTKQQEQPQEHQHPTSPTAEVAGNAASATIQQEAAPGAAPAAHQHHTVATSLAKYLNSLLAVATGKENQVSEYYAESLLRDFPEKFADHSADHYLHVLMESAQNFDNLQPEQKVDVLTTAVKAQAARHGVQLDQQKAEAQLKNLRPEMLVAMMDTLRAIPTPELAAGMSNAVIERGGRASQHSQGTEAPAPTAAQGGYRAVVSQPQATSHYNR